jgi:hypothetical protein
MVRVEAGKSFLGAVAARVALSGRLARTAAAVWGQEMNGELTSVDPIIANLVLKFALALGGLVVAAALLFVSEKWLSGR